MVSKGSMKNAPGIPKKKKKSGNEIKPAIALICPVKLKLKKVECIEINCHTDPENADLPTYTIQVPYFGDGTPEVFLNWLDMLQKALAGQCISDGPGMFNYTECVLTGDALSYYLLVLHLRSILS